MKKLIVSMMLIIGMFAFAAESDPSATVGYVKYPCVAGNNYVALPMQASFGMASDFGVYTGEDGGTFTDGLVSTVLKYDASAQGWITSYRVFAGWWDSDFAVSSGQPYFIYSSAPFNLIVNDEVVVNPAYNIVAGNNALMVPLTKSNMTMASAYGTETGEDGGTFTDGLIGTVLKYDASAQGWITSYRVFAGWWDSDFAIGIGDPHLVYSSAPVVWPGAKIEGTEHVEDGVAPTGTKGNPKTITIGVKDKDVAEYNATTIENVTFVTWLEQGTGAAVPGDSIRLGTLGSDNMMIAYRGCVKFDLQNFLTWGMNNEVHTIIKDENGGLKAYYENYWSWTVDDVSVAAKLVGLAPLNGPSGNAIELNILSSIEDSALPTVTKLHQNYPNPFNPTTTIKFDLASNSNVKLNVYNYNGQLVKSLVNGQMNAGFHSVNFDASNLSAGVYYYTMEAANKTMTSKMVLVK